MQYKEFLDMIGALAEGQVYYFKPMKPIVQNAYQPEVRSKLFQITIGTDGWYRLKYMLLMEEIKLQKDKLDQMFLDQGWFDYTPFSLIDDYNEWIESESNRHFG
ncbi:MAG: hypothetical protein WCF95_07775 [bacterium]